MYDEIKERGVLIVNAKNYEGAYGQKLFEVIDALQRAFEKTGVLMVLAPPVLKLEAACSYVKEKNYSVKIFAQHVDNLSFGSSVGFVPPRGVRSVGAVGTVLNHSAHMLGDIGLIEKAMGSALSSGLFVLLCAEDDGVAGEFARVVDESFVDRVFLAVEPPELVGSGKSVTTEKPGIVKRAVKKVGNENSSLLVVCGAGIKEARDAELAARFGAVGVFVASGVMLARDVRSAVLSLAKGIKKGMG